MKRLYMLYTDTNEEKGLPEGKPQNRDDFEREVATQTVYHSHNPQASKASHKGRAAKRIGTFTRTVSRVRHPRINSKKLPVLVAKARRGLCVAGPPIKLDRGGFPLFFEAHDITANAYPMVIRLQPLAPRERYAPHSSGNRLPLTSLQI